MKKGLRRFFASARIVSYRNTDRPDEEGIKTFTRALQCALVGGNTDRPDEEGIKTSLGKNFQAYATETQTDLMKKGLRQFGKNGLVELLRNTDRPDEEGIKTGW